MSNFRKMLLSTAAIGLVAVAVSPASAGEVEKSVSISGHVNRAIVVSDNGEDTTIGHTDNSSISGSRFRMKAAAKSESMTIGTTIELKAMGDANFNSRATTGDGGTNTTALRVAAITVSSDMGTLLMGYHYGADIGIHDQNMGANGGVTLGANLAAGEIFRVSGDTGTADATVTVGTATLAGGWSGTRESVLNYTTPNMGGFTATVGTGNSRAGSASVRYSGDFDGTKVIAGIGGASDTESTTVDSRWQAGVGVKLAGGFNAAASYMTRNASASGTNDPEGWGVVLGYDMGANGISVVYQNNDNTVANNDETDTYALNVQHKMADYGATVYAGIQNVDYTVAGTNYDDITAGWVGMRVNF